MSTQLQADLTTLAVAALFFALFMTIYMSMLKQAARKGRNASADLAAKLDALPDAGMSRDSNCWPPPPVQPASASGTEKR